MTHFRDIKLVPEDMEMLRQLYGQGKSLDREEIEIELDWCKKRIELLEKRQDALVETLWQLAEPIKRIETEIFGLQDDPKLCN